MESESISVSNLRISLSATEETPSIIVSIVCPSHAIEEVDNRVHERCVLVCSCCLYVLQELYVLSQGFIFQEASSS